MLRYASVGHCDKCKKQTPHNRHGACAVCRSRGRRALRRVKATAQGHGLVRFGEVMKVADDLTSVAARAEVEGCRMCHTPLPPERLQLAHHVSRGRRHMRFHPDNYSILCAACHRRFTPAESNPGWWVWLREERLGPEDYERLQLLARLGGELRLSDLELIILDAHARIAALPEGPRREWAVEREAAISERTVRMGIRSVA